jgi:hypothetical protein
MKLSRRGWNNLLIFALIIFMVVLNLPNVLKSRLQEQERAYPYLLNPDATVEQLHFSRLSLERQGETWVMNQESTISAADLASRWISLAGTEVDEDTFSQLKGSLSSPETIEVWYLDQEEPQRVTYYQTPKFWLLKNWQNKWIAVSVEDSYLFPF